MTYSYKRNSHSETFVRVISRDRTVFLPKKFLRARTKKIVFENLVFTYIVIRDCDMKLR